MPEIKNEIVRWISLSVGLFDDDKISLVESMPDGEILVNCWLRLLCMAGKQNAGGYIFATQSIAYTDEMLASMWKKKLPTVKLALKAFRELEMIDVEQDGKIFVNNFQKWQEPLAKIQANREATRIKVSNWRQNKKLALLPKEESTKEDIHTNTIHNNTIQCNGNSNGNVTVTDIGETTHKRQPISLIPQVALNIMREERRSPDAIAWVSKQKDLVNQLLKAFPQGSGAPQVYNELAGCYEQDPAIADEVADMLEAAKYWPQVKEYIIKRTKADKFPTYSLAGWIKVCGWRQAADFLKEKKAKEARITEPTW